MLKKIIIHADNMQVLSNIKEDSINLVYIDPPYCLKAKQMSLL